MTRVTLDHSALTGPERAVMFAGAIVFHLGLLALFLSINLTSAHPEAPLGPMSLISIAPMPPRSSPPAPALPRKVSNANRVAAKMAVPDDVDPSKAGAAGGCATLDLINKAIVANPAAVAAVLASPPESRSIAEAVVLWNNGWISNASTADAPLGPARLAVEQSLSSLDPKCLDEPIAGPRLVPIPAGSGTMFLVIGSGTWSWRQLLDQPEAFPASEENDPNTVLSSLWRWF